MALAAGSRVGPYEIVGSIGAGGMGEVYRARDSRLNRLVAIKALPDLFSADPDRVARFEREAQLLALLNHPNIAAIHGLEQSGDARFLILELVEGESLGDRIAGGPIPIDEALAIARQIADALEAAHDKGVVHRDLKPANIMLTTQGQVKVLDFGLAKALEPERATSGLHNLAQSPTFTSPAMTAVGIVLGTAAYMAPEQAKGRAVDRRADLWAFGCVLFEMLTGKAAFGGDEVTETLANVLKSEARLEQLPASLSRQVRRVITACLQKDPRQRLASAQDARLLLDGALDSEHVPEVSAAPLVPVWRRLLPYAAGAMFATAALALAAWRFTPIPSEPQVSRFEIVIPEGQEFRNTGRPVVAMAPDGSGLVYNAARGLRLRRLSEFGANVIPGSELPLTGPAFSPDSKHVVFYSTREDQVKRLALSGGAPVVLARDVGNPLGIDWSETGSILLALREGIARLPDGGGTPELIIKCGENERVAMPQLLPGGDAVLFMATTFVGEPQWDRAQVVAQSLRTGERTKILEGARDARYLPTGHLVYAVGDDLFGIAFDPVTLRTSGPSIELVQGVWWRSETTVVANWSVSKTGTLTYVPNVPADALSPVWVGRDGAVVPAEHLPAGAAPRLSRDGKELLVELENDVWIYDVDTGRRRRLTSDKSSGRPAWHPTGNQIAYTSSRSGSPEVWVANADGTGTPHQLTDLPGAVHVDSWSPDGQTLAFHHHPPGNVPNEILTIAPGDPAAKPKPFVQGEFAAEDAVFSPDGRYVAYLSAASGRREIYIRAFPGPGPQVPVSVSGGREPVWGRTGEIFYRTLDGREMMAVKVTTTPVLRVGAPTRIFEGDFFVTAPTGSPRPQYDVTADDRFLMLRADRTANPVIVVVQNWFEELRRQIPAR